jgi:hypothetical protein
LAALRLPLLSESKIWEAVLFHSLTARDEAGLRFAAFGWYCWVD